MRKVTFNIPDFLEDKFINMSDEVIERHLIKLLVKDDNVLDKLCLDIRLAQQKQFIEVMESMNEIKDKLASGAIVSGSNSSGTFKSSAKKPAEIKVEQYVSVDFDDDDDDDDFASSFLS